MRLNYELRTSPAWREVWLPTLELLQSFQIRPMLLKIFKEATFILLNKVTQLRVLHSRTGISGA